MRGRWLYDKVNCVLRYPISQSPPVSTRAGQCGITVTVNGKKLPFSVAAETAVPAGQVDFNFTPKFSFYVTRGYCFNFMTCKRPVFTAFEVFSLLMASSL